MKFLDCVNQLSNVNETKRIASAYVADYRRLDLEELKLNLTKTAGQYISYDNIVQKLDELKLDENQAIRIIAPIILQNYLLDEDDFMSTCKQTDDAILAYEQAIIDASNNFETKNISKDFALLKFMLDTAWGHLDNISVDEKNLIDSVRKYLGISVMEQHMLEAKSSRFPTKGNVLHSRTDIDASRKALQSAGLMLYIKDSHGSACDIIPDEIAEQLRKYYHIEVKTYGYKKLIEYVTKLTKKHYLIEILEKANSNNDAIYIDIPQNPTISILQELLLKYVKPSNLIGGFSPRDGLDMGQLSAWCGDLGLNTYGNKASLIARIIEYYDKLRKIEVSSEDERAPLYAVYSELAHRDLQFLRNNNIISKDINCERLFEAATNYLFEVKLKNKPLNLTGTEHPDGKLSFKDKYIMWDNKSKESPVNLRDHMQQFDSYIYNSDKPVSVFIVIGPSFTENSVQECVQHSLISDTQILLITAEELKSVAEEWSNKHPNESFNLGYFKQNGRFNIELLNL